MHLSASWEGQIGVYGLCVCRYVLCWSPKLLSCLLSWVECFIHGGVHQSGPGYMHDVFSSGTCRDYYTPMTASWISEVPPGHQHTHTCPLRGEDQLSSPACLPNCVSVIVSGSLSLLCLFLSVLPCSLFLSSYIVLCVLSHTCKMMIPPSCLTLKEEYSILENVVICCFVEGWMRRVIPPHICHWSKATGRGWLILYRLKAENQKDQLTCLI